MDPNDSGYHSDTGNTFPRSSSSTPAAIDNLGRTTKKLVDTINKLGEVGVESSGLPLPKIVVLGDQSAGKSSLIEALSEIKVPRSAGTCTRCVLQINLIPAEHSSWTLSLLNKYSYIPGNRYPQEGDFGDWQQKVKPEEVAQISLDLQDIEEYLKRAQNAILCPHMNQSAILDGRIEPNQHVDFSPNVIKLDITGPNLQTLTLYDLPGIINQADGDCNQLPELVQGLAKHYAEHRNTIVVLACPINVDLETSTAASLIHKWDATDRTVGVLTKPDNLPPGDDPEQWVRVLNGKKFDLGHGYYVTKQPSSADLKHGLTHGQARQAEFDFFQHAPWTTTFQDFSKRFGTPALQAKLSDLLAREIATCLPKMKENVQESLTHVTEQLTHYAKPPPNPYNTVLSVVENVRTDVDQVVRGDFPGTTLIRDWRTVNRQFWQTLKSMQPLIVVNTGPEPQWQVSANIIDLDGDDDVVQSPGSKRAASTTSFHESPNKRARSTKQTPALSNSSQGPKFTLDYIRATVMDLTTSGVPNDTDPYAEDHLIKESTSHWESPLREYLNRVNGMIKACLDGIVAERSKQWSNTNFSAALDRAVNECFDSLFDAHEQSAVRTLSAERLKPYTSNSDVLGFFRREQLTFLKEQRRLARGKAYLLIKDRASNKQQNPDGPELTKRAASLKVSEIGEDPYDPEIQVMSRIRGYYHLAAGAFADNISKQSQFDVLEELRARLHSGVLQKKLGIDGDVAECVKTSNVLLSEEPERELKRNELEGEKTKFEKAMALLNEIRI